MTRGSSIQAASAVLVAPRMELGGPRGDAHALSVVVTPEERTERIAAARRDEREADVRLQQLVREGDRGVRDAVHRLAQFDAMLESVKALLRRAGYLG